MRALLGALLVGAYLFALIMSTGHLSEWYRLTLGSLPGWFAIGLAAALEASAFLLSLLSNSILKSSYWANYGSLVALGLVWVGNYFSMARAATQEMGKLEVFLSSLFVPVSTYVVAKVLGELLAIQNPKERERALKEGLGGPKRTLKGGMVDREIQKPVEEEASQEDQEYKPLPSLEKTRPQTPQVSPLEEDKLDKKAFNRKPSSHKEAYLKALREPKTAQELAKELQVGLSTAYRWLNALEKEGLVTNKAGRWQSTQSQDVDVLSS